MVSVYLGCCEKRYIIGLNSFRVVCGKSLLQRFLIGKNGVKGLKYMSVYKILYFDSVMNENDIVKSTEKSWAIGIFCVYL